MCCSFSHSHSELSSAVWIYTRTGRFSYLNSRDRAEVGAPGGAAAGETRQGVAAVNPPHEDVHPGEGEVGRHPRVDVQREGGGGDATGGAVRLYRVVCPGLVPVPGSLNVDPPAQYTSLSRAALVTCPGRGGRAGPACPPPPPPSGPRSSAPSHRTHRPHVCTRGNSCGISVETDLQTTLSLCCGRSSTAASWVCTLPGSCTVDYKNAI